MADETINQQTEETAPTSDDLLLLWEVASATTKKVTLANLGSNGAWMDTGGLVDDAVDGTKLDGANSEFASWVPSGTDDLTSGTYADFGNGTATLTIPSWATKVRIQANINRVIGVTSDGTYDIRLVVGSDNGTAVQQKLDASLANSENISWADEITLTGTGSQTLKIQAKLSAGGGAMRVITSSSFTFIVEYIA